MKVDLNQHIPVEDLKKFLSIDRKHKTFEYIFFE
jgi:hypothetical protein